MSPSNPTHKEGFASASRIAAEKNNVDNSNNPAVPFSQSILGIIAFPSLLRLKPRHSALTPVSPFPPPSPYQGWPPQALQSLAKNAASLPESPRGNIHCDNRSGKQNNHTTATFSPYQSHTTDREPSHSRIGSSHPPISYNPLRIIRVSWHPQYGIETGSLELSTFRKPL